MSGWTRRSCFKGKSCQIIIRAINFCEDFMTILTFACSWRVASKCKMRINGQRLSSTEGSMVEILEFLRQRGPSRFPQVRLSIHAPCSCHAPVCYALVLGQNQIFLTRHQASLNTSFEPWSDCWNDIHGGSIMAFKSMKFVNEIWRLTN